jgi:CYTH domain-containing protein
MYFKGEFLMPIETERKFIIEMPDICALSTYSNYQKSRIEQIYLNSENCTHRIRKRVYKDKTVYTETKKTRISSMSAIENENEISEEKYNNLKKMRRNGTKILEKTRHSFTFGTHTVEIDVYPEWKRSAVMEIELESENSSLTLPSSVKILREVTGNYEYSNAKMSECFPNEIV